ncbi:hypothetical protein ABNZ43_03875 [Weissella sp. GP1]|uniref:hypothetical protein n=1 Tax=Weissella confusa TaxID=1583 RepID=UPI0032DA70B1
MNESFDLTECLANITTDSQATDNVLAYIDQQHGFKDKYTIQSEMGALLNVQLSVSDSDAILACVLSYSDHYRSKILELIAS